MTQIYRTTKIPEVYFERVEQAIRYSREFVSVSEFIRDAIKEKLTSLTREKYSFLLLKDLVFNEEFIIATNELLDKKNNILKEEAIKKAIELSLDADLYRFLAKFLKNFAYLHPFKDGNKRSSWIAVDAFLRLNNKMLSLKADKNKETEDEVFIWQNSSNQKTIDEIMVFLKNRAVAYDDNSNDPSKEREKAIKKNRLLLEKLAR